MGGNILVHIPSVKTANKNNNSREGHFVLPFFFQNKG